MTLSDLYAKATLDPISGCLNWSGAINNDGYGHVGISKKTYKVHRLAMILFTGKAVPSKMCVLHKCDNKHCINVAHLFLGTYKDNAIDMVQKGRHAEQLKTCCPKGHQYSEENTIRYGNKRQCKECSKQRDRLRNERKRQATKELKAIK